MQHETVIVLDFGGQYNQLIARRVRENNVYCEIYSYKTDLSVIKAKNPKGIIFTGGPNSVYLEDSPTIDPEIFNWGIPVLGICYGSQLMMHLLGGHVCRAPEREYGKTEVFVDNSSKMFEDVQPSTICWMSHNDYIEQAAPGFKITAHTVNSLAEKKRRSMATTSHVSQILLSSFVLERLKPKRDFQPLQQSRI
jgi:GMP synthase (glutamine-hydrolysing)